jgi:hypothetical protein
MPGDHEATQASTALLSQKLVEAVRVVGTQLGKRSLSTFAGALSALWPPYRAAVLKTRADRPQQFQ